MKQHRRSYKRSALLGLSGLGLTTAVVISGDSHADISSVRKSINYGPSTPVSWNDINRPSLSLSSFNAHGDFVASLAEDHCVKSQDTPTTDCKGLALATAFLHLLHPASAFSLVDGYTTGHLNVFHAYFVETKDDIPIANSNININVDLDSNSILGFGDSSFSKASGTNLDAAAAAVSNKLDSWKDTLAGWAREPVASTAQLVFGNQLKKRSLFDEYSSPPLVSQSKDARVDPRHGLVSFLAFQDPSVSLHQILKEKDFRLQFTEQLAVSATSAGVFQIDNVPSTEEPVKASLAYINNGGELKLTWKYEVRTADNHYEAYVSTEQNISGDYDALMVVDWVRDFRPTGGEVSFSGSVSMAQHTSIAKSYAPINLSNRRFKMMSTSALSQGTIDASDEEAVKKFKETLPTYKVFPWGVNAPDVGKRSVLQGSSVELDEEASPVGWHTIPSLYKGGKAKYFTDTRGNNVFAQDNPDGGSGYEHNYRPVAGSDLIFDYPLHWPKDGKDLDPKTYINASVSQLFYTNNEIHDLFYRYGFDEISGNFQESNFERGGLGGDAVQANAQDGSGMNNANFATPPDGSRPRMRMYSWSGSHPYRDGDFEAGIVIHEYAHGISTRLTGGPANSGCLGWGEAGGMGEGWGDFFATMIRMRSANETEFTMGEWASNRAGGIRNFPYNKDMEVNPSTYTFLDKPGYWGVHAIGEVWAEILFTISQLFIEEHGFEPTLFPPHVNSTDTSFYSEKYPNKKVPKAGNTLLVQLVVDGFKLQPCRPSFQDARDAILLADKKLTGGANECILWKGFSSRGLGPDASVVGSTPWGGGIRTNDFNLPNKCQSKRKSVEW